MFGRRLRRRLGPGGRHCRGAGRAIRHGLGANGTMTLDEVPVGTQVDIVRVGGEKMLRRRLMEMGLVAGETVRIQRVAPLGDPIELRVKGYDLAVRRSEARSIEVRIASDHHHGRHDGHGQGPGKARRGHGRGQHRPGADRPGPPPSDQNR